ncbi:SDR family oxidoreductase [Alteromonas sp. KUL49]|uniref:SDR family NAD(P)-dependent oxidoreductase n=1 Tax=Alteromonas sp. KUL49 TaxID=2480798 RepID=UPI00102F04E9|nr:SDR family oxidoreductase [Alteromonas sp. KUL49]TAP37889.1 SDR family oxidoreductase [Alteromonas sp. KUL49]GEA12749.1 oxidoreductase [Alteromonas sp. KUL49]
MENSDMKWCLVTGANGGIGKALTSCFVENGYSVIATDITKSSETSSNIVNLQIDLERIVLDEAYADEFKSKVDDITNDKGLTALINNAAIQILGNVKEVTRQDWLRSMNVNVSAPFFVTQLFLDSLKSNSGAVVNISSIHALQTKRNFVTYATSKGALSSLTRNMAVDLGNAVRINAIEPAAVSTDMLRAGFEGKEEQFRLLEAFHPIARIASPEEVAQLALFLCSEQSSFIHGTCLNATGGIHGCLSDPD